MSQLEDQGASLRDRAAGPADLSRASASSQSSIPSASYTPGPWKVADKSYGWDHFAAVVTEGPNGPLIANCHIAALSRSHEQTGADARLIAAAPELLEALQLVWETYGFDPSIDSSVWQTVRAAIAKATGGAA